MPINISEFATRQLALLSAELDAERAETELLTSTHAPTVLQRAGLALLNLTVTSQRTGLGGKTLLELGPDPAVSSASELPEHGFRVGDICGVAEQPKGAERKKEREGMERRGLDGVVTRVQKGGLVIALDKEDTDVPGGRLWIVKLANDVTNKRLNQTMTRLQTMQPTEHSSLMNTLFGRASVTPISEEDLKKDIKWQDPTLNDSQKDAIRFALASREIALIHGPPGTGKTHTLIELILQLLAQKQRLLVCGPSNISVDNIVERLAPHKIAMVRLGHPARLLPGVIGHSMEVLTRTSDAAAIVSDIREEMDSKQASIRKTRNGRERRAIYGELKELRKEFRQRETRVVGDLLRSSQVVLSTLHGAGGFQMKDQKFDVVIVDEASQALEAQCWIPVLTTGAPKLVLAGDHLQLPPTVKSRPVSSTQAAAADKAGDGTEAVSELEIDDAKKTKIQIPSRSREGVVLLQITLFTRLLNLYGDKIKRMLTTQYRMHEQIMAFPSTLYGNKLIAAESVKTRLLEDLPYGVEATEDTQEPVVFWDTQGGDFPEKNEDDGTGEKAKTGLLAQSKVNEHEAAIVRNHVSKLVAAGVHAEDIAVVTPYNGQLALLSQMLKEKYPGIEIGSVDGFQGREKEAIILSLVRSNPEHEVGFLSEKRRLNGKFLEAWQRDAMRRSDVRGSGRLTDAVAMTRPKRHLCVVGDAETISRGSSFLAAWMAHLEEKADLRYPDLAQLLEQD